MAEDFSVNFSNLPDNLLNKLSNPSDKYCLLSIVQYYSYFGLTKNFDLLPIEKDCILKILRDINTSKAAGIDKHPGKFSKDCASVLANPVTDLFNPSVFLNVFLGAFKQRLNLFSKKTGKVMFQITNLLFAVITFEDH